MQSNNWECYICRSSDKECLPCKDKEKEVCNLKANNVKLEKKLDNMTHELKLCQERCNDLEDRLHKEKKLGRRVERDLENFNKVVHMNQVMTILRVNGLTTGKRNQGSMKMARKANHEVTKWSDRMVGISHEPM